MTNLVKTMIKETTLGSYKAEIYSTPSGFDVKYYSPSKELIETREYKTFDFNFMEDVVSNWFAGIGLLNG